MAAREKRAWADELDRRTPGVGINPGGPGGWPFGPNIYVDARERLLNWAERRKLKLAKSYCRDLHWPRKGRCAVREC